VIIVVLLTSLYALLFSACSEGFRGTQTDGDLVAGNAAASDAAGSPSGSEPKQISIVDFRYVPDTLRVLVGTKVTWTNQDDMPHTVTSTAKPRAIDSEALDTDARFSYVFTEPGTYNYLCTLHPQMKGRVIVEKR
jgi:amicyanin